MNEIGERIKKAREKAHLKQSELAERLGKVQTTIASMENGRSTESFKTLKAICEILDVSADWILFGYEKQEKENLSDEGQKMLKEYKKYLEQNYPAKKDYEKVGNL